MLRDPLFQFGERVGIRLRLTSVITRRPRAGTTVHSYLALRSLAAENPSATRNTSSGPTRQPGRAARHLRKQGKQYGVIIVPAALLGGIQGNISSLTSAESFNVETLSAIASDFEPINVAFQALDFRVECARRQA
jgi:hypothetical protein